MTDNPGRVAEIVGLLYKHREGALTCYSHPPTPARPAWCCTCGAHGLLVSWREHVAEAIANAEPAMMPNAPRTDNPCPFCGGPNRLHTVDCAWLIAEHALARAIPDA